MLKRYCDVCGKGVTDKYMVLCSKQNAVNPLTVFMFGECPEISVEMCQECYEEFHQMFQDFREEKAKCI